MNPFPRCLLVLSCTTWALPAQAPPPTVRVVAPTLAATGETYNVPGRTEPLEQARIFTRATGIVRERRFDIGDRVAAGAVMAVIDVPEIDRGVEAAQAAIEQAEARAASAAAIARRAQALAEQDVASREDAEVRASEAAAAEAAVRIARAEHARLLELQRFATVRAPFDGIVAARNFDRGDRVRGDAAGAEGWLYQLVRVDELRFVCTAAPDLALRVSASPRAVVRFREFPGREFAVVRALRSGVFDPVVGTMRVELLLANVDLTLPAGMTGTATFALDAAPGTFLVPTNALQLREGSASIMVVEDGKATRIEVAAGRTRGTTIEVASARLTARSQVIVNPNALLRDGDAVQLAPPPER